MHVTDGAQFQHDVSNTLEPMYAGDPELHPAAQSLVAELNGKLASLGSLPLDFYPSFLVDDDPASGFGLIVAPPRFSTGYWSLHNRFALLVETHSWKDYATRVRVTRNIIVTLAEMTAREGSRWRAQTHAADVRAQQLGGQTVALDFDTGPHVTTIDFRGYAYTRDPSAISGSLVTRYDPPSHKSGTCRCATPSWPRSARRRLAAATSCRRRMRHGWRTSSPCTASAS